MAAENESQCCCCTPRDRLKMKSVVALGGGHGLSNVLKSLALIPDIDISAIVSVADDGGSSGRLRKELDVVAPGDVRSCLLALSTLDERDATNQLFNYRFDSGELDGHSLGNLMLVALARELGSFELAVEKAAELLKVDGKILPATESSVVLCAETPTGIVRGQVSIEKCSGIGQIHLDPPDVVPNDGVIKALENADHILYAPGSLFTSLIPVVVISEISKVIAQSNATVTMILNLSNKGADTVGLDGDGHVSKVVQHGGRVDQVLFDESSLSVDNLDVKKISANLSYDHEVHDEHLLMQALKQIFS